MGHAGGPDVQWKLIDQCLVGPGAVLKGANLTGADLSRIDLLGSELLNDNFTGANLTGTRLGGSSLEDPTSGGLIGSPVSMPQYW